jgi:plasmid stability protein
LATLTIRDLDDALKLKLRLRAARQNRSMEEEARQILRAALADSNAPSASLVERIRKRFDGLGDVQLPLEPREAIRAPTEINEAPASYESSPEPSRRAAARKSPRAKRSRP